MVMFNFTMLESPSPVLKTIRAGLNILTAIEALGAYTTMNTARALPRVFVITVVFGNS